MIEAGGRVIEATERMIEATEGMIAAGGLTALPHAWIIEVRGLTELPTAPI